MKATLLLTVSALTAFLVAGDPIPVDGNEMRHFLAGYGANRGPPVSYVKVSYTHKSPIPQSYRYKIEGPPYYIRTSHNVPAVKPETHSLYTYNPSHEGFVPANVRLHSVPGDEEFEVEQQEEDSMPFSRSAVEKINIEADFYAHTFDEYEESLPFSRGDVESLPGRPTVYISESFEDQAINAIVLEVPAGGEEDVKVKVEPKSELAGYRLSAESPPLMNHPFDPEESYPFLPHLNSRPYGQVFEGFDDDHPIYDEDDIPLVGALPIPSRAGADLQQHKPAIRMNQADYKLICYYGGWSAYREEPFKFTVLDIDPHSCTHLIYSFAGLQKDNNTMMVLDEELDIVKGAYKLAINLKEKNPNLKVMVAIGGWNEGGRKYSHMASTPENRKAFVDSALKFMLDYNWDGLDLDWEYPGASDRGGKYADKSNFAKLCQELSEAFKPHGLMLTAAVSPAKFRVNEGYDVKTISQYLDFINIMTYDMRGPWDGKADHHAPIRSRTTDAWSYKSLNCEDGVDLWIEKGAPPEKLILGVPFYGRSFTLSSQSRTQIRAQARGGGKKGKYTQEAGFLAYYEICMELKQGGWKLLKDEAGGPYMVKGDQWVGFDDADYITAKMDLLKSKGMGGAMIWAIDLDDNVGVCGSKWPLLSAMRRSLLSSSVPIQSEGPPPDVSVGKPEVPPTPAPSPTPTPTPRPGGDRKKPEPTTREPVPEIQPETSSAKPDVPMDIDMPCQAGDSMKDPKSCNGYLRCVHGNFEQFYCPEGLHWNPRNKNCDWPSNVKCDASAPPPLPPPTAGPDPGDSRPQPEEGKVGPDGSKKKPDSVKPPITSVDFQHKAPACNDESFILVCYFTNWAWYRPTYGKYKPEDIDPSMCTHIVYGFAVLDYSNLIIKMHDSWADKDNHFYEKVTALRRKGIHVSIAIGGWNDSQGDKYSRLVNSPGSRKKFIKHVLDFILTNNFSGLDLDWEYPVCWQVDCSKGPASDKEGFSALVKELKEAFEPHGLLLSAAVSPSKKVIDHGYNVPAMNKYLDWIAVMTYDFHGHWDKKTGHVAPMYLHPDDDNKHFNVDYALNYWISQGASPSKVVAGMPLYGQSFTLDDPAVNGLNAPARQKGTAGPETRAAGFLAYYEICEAVRNGWTVVKDPEERMGPYAYSGNQWVSYDDAHMLEMKSKYIREKGLCGGMIWALDLDDFKGRCGQGPYPLLSTIKSVLAPPRTSSEVIGPRDQTGVSGGTGGTVPEPAPEPSPQVPERMPDPAPVDPEPVPQPSPEVTHTESPKPDVIPMPMPDGEYKVVCYFTNWAWYRPGHGKYKPEHIDTDLCTHIVYGFAVLDAQTLTIKPHDTWADYDNKFYEKVTALKNRGVKVLIALGGWNDSKGGKYSKLVNSVSSRRKFNDHVVQFIQTNNFDGLDLDWEYPKCWQVDCSAGPVSDKANFALWVKELKEALQPHGFLLSSAVSPSRKVIDNGYEVPILNQYLDWIAVMTYDYHGQWDKKTGHVAPMYGHPEDDDPCFNANCTIHYWIDKGADRKKLVMGMPMYGQSFTRSWESKGHGLNEPATGGGPAGTFTRARGFKSYYEICAAQQRSSTSYTVVQDTEGRMGPYAYKNKEWVGFDDASMIKYKSEYVKKMGLGGAMIWALDLDDFNNVCGCEPYPLLKTINRVLRNYPQGRHMCRVQNRGAPTDVSIRPASPAPSTVASPQTVRMPDPTPSSSLPDHAKCKEGEKERHKDCGRFTVCRFGARKTENCLPGLHFDGVRCTWPRDANCISRQQPASTSVMPTKPVTTPTLPPVTTAKPTRTTNKWNTQYVPWKPTTTPLPPPAKNFDVDLATIPDTGYKVVCYFTNWAWYRRGQGKYRPEDIDASLCTHIVYGFAVLDATNLVMKPHDSWADIDNHFFRKVTAFRQFGVKVLIAIGGWNDSKGPKYSNLVNSKTARTKFIDHAIGFIQKYGFDGLDLDWEYPVCWQVDCSKGPATDKEGFSAWVKELRAAFEPRGLLLSAAVSPSYKVIDAGYDVPVLSQNLDWIAVMTYDYHGHWDKKTGHVAPMYEHPNDTVPEFNTNYTIHYWLQKGADAKKLVMGMPLYGQAFQLGWKSESKGLNEHAPMKGVAGPFTRAAGFLAFYEICAQKEGWTVVNDPLKTMGPYKHNGRNWVGYDDVDTIRYKSEYIKKMGLGGGMIWALDLDDFRNVCGCERHPLLRTINRVLRNYPTPDPRCNI